MEIYLEKMKLYGKISFIKKRDTNKIIQVDIESKIFMYMLRDLYTLSFTRRSRSPVFFRFSSIEGFRGS